MTEENDVKKVELQLSNMEMMKITISAPNNGYHFFNVAGLYDGGVQPQVMFSMVHNKSFKPATAPTSKPAHIAQPEAEENVSGTKKPPVVQPPASVAPIPIRVPPTAAQIYSSGGGRLIWNWRDNSAALNAPRTREMFIIEIRCTSGLSSCSLIPSTVPRPMALLR